MSARMLQLYSDAYMIYDLVGSRMGVHAVGQRCQPRGLEPTQAGHCSAGAGYGHEEAF